MDAIDTDMIHGGDVAGFRLRYGRAPLDFSASLNPLGMPEAVRAAAVRAAGEDSVAYPDPLCRRLAAAVAEQRGVPEEFLFFGNGAADIIHRLVQGLRPERAVVVAPGFAEYERALACVGCRVDRHRLWREDGFALGEGILSAIDDRLKGGMLFLCQPNNPTGRAVAPALLRAVLERCAAAGALLVADECFRHFLAGGESSSLVPFLKDFPALVVLDSFTKLYGMAGLRLGYALSSNRAALEKIAAAGQPWAVSAVAQAAGLAAVGEAAFVAESLARIARAKRALLAGLGELSCGKLSVEVFGADANYVFFHSPVVDLDARLAREGIMIRNCANFPGLGAGYFRVAVRLEQENQILLDAMAKAVNG